MNEIYTLSLPLWGWIAGGIGVILVCVASFFAAIKTVEWVLWSGISR